MHSLLTSQGGANEEFQGRRFTNKTVEDGRDFKAGSTEAKLTNDHNYLLEAIEKMKQLPQR